MLFESLTCFDYTSFMPMSLLPDPTYEETMQASSNNLSGSLPTSFGQLTELSEWVDDACTTTVE